MADKNTSMGLNENLEGLLCYAFGWLSGVIFFIVEKKSKFVRFHALQSLIFFLSVNVIIFVLGYIPILGAIVAIPLSILSLVYWIIGMIKAYKGENYKFLIVGNIAEEKVK